MSVSTTTDFNLTASQIVEKAFHILGKASEGEALTARMASDGLSSLNLLIKTMGAQTHLWTTEDGVLTTMVAGQAAYTLNSPKPMRILAVRRVLNGITTPMNEMARQDYFDQPNKTTSPSTPVSFYYDPQTTFGTLYLWPAPNSTILPDTTLEMTYLRRMADMDVSNNDLDMPQEWLQAICWALASDLETEYPVNDPRLANKIDQKAAMLVAQLRSWDQEPASLFLQPDNRWDGDNYGHYGHYRGR